MKVVIGKNGEDDKLPCVIGGEREADCRLAKFIGKLIPQTRSYTYGTERFVILKVEQVVAEQERQQMKSECCDRIQQRSSYADIRFGQL